MIAAVNGYKIQELKRRLGIETGLSIHYTTYLSGSNKVIERGYITQDGSGDLKKEIQTLMTGSIGWTMIRLIYTEWPSREPTIRTARI